MALSVLEKANTVCGEFDTQATYRSLEPYGNGHINDTFLLSCARTDGSPRRFILQRVNRNVFTKPEQVMENIIGVTAYLRQQFALQGPPPDMREVLTLVPATAGKLYHIDDEGQLWRLYDFVEHTVTFEHATSPQLFYNSACAFGDFFMMLADYPSHTLYETIPDFHNTPQRLCQLTDAIQSDPLGRAGSVGPEIDFVLARKEDIHFLRDLQEAGQLPTRVTHNDTKLNNVLLDETTTRGACVIDLDTVMPGLAAYDFGDSIRFGATTCEEDEPDLAKCGFSLDMYRAYAKGYLARAGAKLTPKEVEVLPMGAKLMTLECGMRFLADYINGDHYFKIHRESHNLDRCRTQFKLVESMEQQWDAMVAAIEELKQ